MGEMSRRRVNALSLNGITVAGLIVLLLLLPTVSAYTNQSNSKSTTQTIISARAKAFIAYASNTGSYTMSAPKGQTWTGSTWSNLEELETSGGTLRWVRVVHCPLISRYYEKIVVSLSSDEYLTAQVWNGNNWVVTDDIGKITAAGTDYRSFDIAYETTNGRAVLVYSVDSTNTARDLAYRIWDGSSWSTEAYIDDPGHGTNIQFRWVALRANPVSGSNELALIAINQSSGDCNAWIWNGSTWGNFLELESALSGVRDCECMAVAYESLSGKALFAWCAGSNIESRVWNGAAWEAELPAIAITTLNVRWVSIKPDPASNQIMALTMDGQSHLNTILWDGSSWATPLEHTTSLTHDTRRCADFEWEPSESKGLIVYSVASGSVTYKTYTAPATWGEASTPANAGTHPWIQLRRNPRDVSGDVKIFGATLNSNDDLWGFGWNGSTLTFEASAFTTDTTVTTYECFDLAVRPYISPLN